MSTENPPIESEAQASEDKSIGIIAYLTFIGLIIAFVMNKDKNDVFGAYHIRQSLGICVTGIALFVVGMVPILGWIISFLGTLFLIFLWIMGLLNAINGKLKPVPVLGTKFEQWFANL